MRELSDSRRRAGGVREGDDREIRRVAELERLELLNAGRHPDFDEVVTFAAEMLGVPIAAFSLVDESRNWFKASVGIGIDGIDRTLAFCDHVVNTDDTVVVADTGADDRFRSSAFVTGEPGIRAYVGVPVRSSGLAIGSLCVADQTQRSFAPAEIGTLGFLAHQLEHLVDLHARRGAELPPPLQAVVDAAEAIEGGESFADAVSRFSRPAWIYDHDTLRFLTVNDVAERIYGWSSSEFCSKSILDIRPASDRPLLKAVVSNLPGHVYPGGRIWRHHRADGEVIDVRIVSAPTVFGGRPAQLVVVTDVSARVMLSGALERAAHSDSLTGLANRREFVRTLTEVLDEPGAASVAVALIDLDRFKVVNDTIGHDAGDALLSAAAARIAVAAPADALVARLGGDEFALYYGATNPSDAITVGEQIRRRLEEPFRVDMNDFYVSASIGVATARPGSTPRGLLSDADAAMYAAKESGRNSVVAFDSHLRARLVEWSELQRDLHRALDEHQLTAHLQPVISLHDADNQVIAREVLVRWNHPTRGLLMPASFIDVAEESGQIRRLGAQMLHRGAELAAASGIPSTVNVSVHQFNNELVADIQELNRRYRLSRGQLVIEVTESAIVDTAHAKSILHGLRDCGAHVWIDDFGTGFSSLARLADLTVDGLKLDRRFVADLGTDRGWGIAHAIVGIAGALDIIVIAEGVETAEQLNQVSELGCHAAQGYLLGRPTSPTL